MQQSSSWRAFKSIRKVGDAKRKFRNYKKVSWKLLWYFNWHCKFQGRKTKGMKFEWNRSKSFVAWEKSQTFPNKFDEMQNSTYASWKFRIRGNWVSWKFCGKWNLNQIEVREFVKIGDCIKILTTSGDAIFLPASLKKFCGNIGFPAAQSSVCQCNSSQSKSKLSFWSFAMASTTGNCFDYIPLAMETFTNSMILGSTVHKVLVFISIKKAIATFNIWSGSPLICRQKLPFAWSLVCDYQNSHSEQFS